MLKKTKQVHVFTIVKLITNFNAIFLTTFSTLTIQPYEDVLRFFSVGPITL